MWCRRFNSLCLFCLLWDVQVILNMLKVAYCQTRWHERVPLSMQISYWVWIPGPCLDPDGSYGEKTQWIYIYSCSTTPACQVNINSVMCLQAILFAQISRASTKLCMDRLWYNTCVFLICDIHDLLWLWKYIYILKNAEILICWAFF